MKINGVELPDIDIFDLEVAKKCDKALNKVTDMKDKVKGMTMVKIIETECTAIFEVFNTIFGDGTDKKLFGEKVNLMVCMKAFEELVLQINEQKKEMDKITEKYAPNRVQRRIKK
ncbi:AP endonuclease [Clostridium botulinum]|uniref:DUF6673 family protein n=1 Tax=Clostridium botulinum TaxID=1491 RepID=UPI00174C4A87|nr:DUF6673 family protein [Clostridium botulinum]MBD5642774.1 AP endonuclease [Clostridium botulinum]